MRKIWSVFMIGALLVGSLAGCGSKDTGNAAGNTDKKDAAAPAEKQAEPVASGEKVELRIAWWGSQLRNDLTQQVIDKFMEENPNISIQAEFSDFPGHWDKLATQAAANNLPDIIQQDYKYIGQYAQKGVLAPLDDFIATGAINTGDISQNIMDASKVDGKVYGIALGVNSQSMNYDPAVLEKAGVVLKENMTWEDFNSIAKTIYEKTGVYTPPVYQGDILRGIEVDVRNAGYSLYSKDNKSLGFEDPAVVETYFARTKQYMDEKICTPVEYMLPGQTEEEKPLSKGVDWVTFAWSNQLAGGIAAAGRPLQLAPLPQASDAKQNSHYIKPSMFFSIAQTSPHQKEAAMFIDYFTNSIEANKILQAERGVPVSSKVREALITDVPDATKATFEFVTKIEKIASPIDPPEPAGAGEITTMVTSIVDELLYGKATPKDAAERFMKGANEILAK